MNRVSGIVMTTSYYYIDQNNNYRINFSMQVDRKIFIFGELSVHLQSNRIIEFLPGENITIQGNISYSNGCRIDADNYQISL